MTISAPIGEWEAWVRTAADARAVDEGCWFDLAAAERVRTFLRKFLVHSKGQWAGQPFELMEWQWRDLVAPLFGWKRADGTRRYRRGYIEIPKKNGKSTLFSGLSLYLLIADNEPGSEVYSAAVDRDQASIVFNEAANMVEASAHLSSRLNVVRSTKRIVHHKSKSFYKALSADVPAKENSFRRYRLNQWTQQDVRWLSMEKWDACIGDVEDLDGKPCFGGLDLSTTTDISALVLVFPEDGFKALCYFWVPEEGAHRREKRDRVPYLRWAKQGLIEMTPGEVVDYDVVRRRINELGQRFDIRELAIDRWNATQLAGQLEGDGFEIVAFGQGFADMNFPTKKLEELVLAGTLAHGGHPVLRWMASNVSVETDAAGNWKPSKKKSRERIDGIVALIMGIARAATQPVEDDNYWTPEMGVTL